MAFVGVHSQSASRSLPRQGLRSKDQSNRVRDETGPTAFDSVCSVLSSGNSVSSMRGVIYSFLGSWLKISCFALSLSAIFVENRVSEFAGYAIHEELLCVDLYGSECEHTRKTTSHCGPPGSLSMFARREKTSATGYGGNRWGSFAVEKGGRSLLVFFKMVAVVLN